MSGYIGNIPVPQATQTRQTFTATASQTTFNTAGYSVGYVDVFLNGVKLAPADYTATNGSDIILAVGAASGDILEIVAYEIFQVLDQDFTGDFTVDGTTFVVDSTNNRIGINTSSPSMTIDVDGSSGPNDVARFSGPNSGGLTFRNATANEFIMHTATSDALIFGTAGNNERMRIDSSGNVGIGTASPSQSWTGGTARTVQLQGPSSTITVLRVNEASDTYGDLQLISGASNEVALYNFNNGAMRLGTNGSERMRIDSSGNLLVGTTSTAIVGSGGLAAKPQGSGVRLDISNSGGAAMLLDRRTNDGDIISFYHDGTNMGGIGTSFDNLLIQTAGNKSGIRFDTNNITPFKNGSEANGTVDLGYSSGRFKDLYLSGGILADGISSVSAMREKVTVTLTTSGTINADLLSGAVVYFSANQLANRTINFRGDGSNTLNSIMDAGQSITFAALMAQGSTAYYLNAYQVDGSSVTPKWQGGSAPTGGNASGIDAYTFTIIKTASATFTVLASQTQFA